MKSKMILITYLNNGDIANVVAKEVMFNKILADLTNDGREVSFTSISPKSKQVNFDDGTKLLVEPFGSARHGMRVTHIYVDESIMFIPRGEEVFKKAYMPCVVSGDYQNWDTEGDRVFSFKYEHGELKTKTLN